MGTLAAAIHATVYRGGGDPDLVYSLPLVTSLSAAKAVDPAITVYSDAEGDHTVDGYGGQVWSCKPNEARFHNLRRVENLLTHSHANGTSLPATWQLSTGSCTYSVSHGVDSHGAYVEVSFDNGTGGAQYPQFRFAGATQIPIRPQTYVGFSVTCRMMSVRVNATLYTDVIQRDAGGGYLSPAITATNLYDFSFSGVRGVTSHCNNAGCVYAQPSISSLLNPGEGITYRVYSAQFSRILSTELPGPEILNAEVNYGANCLGVQYFQSRYSATRNATTGLLTHTAISSVPDNESYGYVCERGTTNIIQQSEDFSQAIWGKGGGCVITANAGICPSGAIHAQKLSAPSAGADINVTHSYTSSSARACFSVFVKAVECNFVCLYILDSGYANYARAYFNLTTGAVSNIGNVGSASIKEAFAIPYADGWWRVFVFIHGLPASGTCIARFDPESTAGGSTVTNAGDGILAWGAQLEQNQITTYIPTKGAAATRSNHYLVALRACVDPIAPSGNGEMSVYFPYGSQWEANARHFSVLASPLTVLFTSGWNFGNNSFFSANVKYAETPYNGLYRGVRGRLRATWSNGSAVLLGQTRNGVYLNSVTGTPVLPGDLSINQPQFYLTDPGSSETDLPTRAVKNFILRKKYRDLAWCQENGG